jgi:hypothetical protein
MQVYPVLWNRIRTNPQVLAESEKSSDSNTKSDPNTVVKYISFGGKSPINQSLEEKKT